MSSKEPKRISFKIEPKVRYWKSRKDWSITGMSSEERMLWDVADRITKREAPRLQSNFGPNVMGIAPGLRIKTKVHRVYRELVIRIYVARKFDENETWPKNVRPIPPFFVGYDTTKTPRVRIEVPTDVASMENGGPQGIEAAITCRIGPPPQGNSGSLCAIVEKRKGTSGQLYGVTCKHVVPGLDGACGPSGPARVVRGDGSPIGTVFKKDHAPWSATRPPFKPVKKSVDAVLCKVKTPSSVSSRIEGIRAYSWLRRGIEYERITPQTDVVVATRRGLLRGRVTGKPYMSEFSGYTCDGLGDHVIKVWRAIEYSAPTQAGDSGSAVYIGMRSGADGLDEGILAGIHFYGRDGFGYAIFMGDVITHKMWGGGLKLVKKHNL